MTVDTRSSKVDKSHTLDFITAAVKLWEKLPANDAPVDNVTLTPY